MAQGPLCLASRVLAPLPEGGMALSPSFPVLSPAEEASSRPAAAGEAQACREPYSGPPRAAAAGAQLRCVPRCEGAAWAALGVQECAPLAWKGQL